MTNKRDVVTQATAFALNGGRIALTRAVDVKGGLNCRSVATTAPVAVRDVDTGGEVSWTPDATLVQKQKTSEHGAGGGEAFYVEQWSPDGKSFAVSTCQGECLVKFDSTPGAASLSSSLVPLSASKEWDSVAWSSAGLFVATGDQLCCDGPSSGQTVSIDKYDASTLAPQGSVFHGKDTYFVDEVVSTPTTLYVVARPYAPGAASGSTGKVHLTTTDHLYTLGATGTLAPIGPATLDRGMFAVAQ